MSHNTTGRPVAAHRGLVLHPGDVLRAFRSAWEEQIGAGYELPEFQSAETAQFRAQGQAYRVDDVAVTDARLSAPLSTRRSSRSQGDWVRLYVIQRGEWVLTDDRGQVEHRIRAGGFLLHHLQKPLGFDTTGQVEAQILMLPGESLRALLGTRMLSGRADTAEVRLLLAHLRNVRDVLDDLQPSGVSAARNALLELVLAVIRGRSAAAGTLTSQALVEAARSLADLRLTQPGLSSSDLAQELAVSVRTLQRAFSAGGETVSGYLHRRRLEEARSALLRSQGRANVSELAARWQFTDGSHFTRAFRRHFGHTPSEALRRHRSDEILPQAQAHDPSPRRLEAQFARRP